MIVVALYISNFVCCFALDGLCLPVDVENMYSKNYDNLYPFDFLFMLLFIAYTLAQLEFLSIAMRFYQTVSREFIVCHMHAACKYSVMTINPSSCLEISLLKLKASFVHSNTRINIICKMHCCSTQ
jgi:hypothetical protein